MAIKKSPAARQQPMAYVDIGYHGYLLPIADAQRLVGIIAGAVRAEQEYTGSGGYVYKVRQAAAPVMASLTVVHAKQIEVVPEQGDFDRDEAPRRLGGPTR